MGPLYLLKSTDIRYLKNYIVSVPLIFKLPRHKKPCSWSYKWESDLLSTMWLWYLGSSSVISALQRLWILCSFYLPWKHHARLRCTENSNSTWFYYGNMPREVPTVVGIINLVTVTVHYHSINKQKHLSKIKITISICYSLKYRCVECDKQLRPTSGNISVGGNEPRLCDYTGLSFCGGCHWSATSVIPAR